MPAPIVVLSAVRTPWGRLLGSLSDISAVDLAALAVREALRRAGVDPAHVDRVLLGNTLADDTGGSPAAAAARAAGLPRGVTAITYRVGCASGLAAVAGALEAIASGRARVVLAGGFESSSRAPHLAHGLRRGLRLGGGTLLDSARHDGPTGHDPAPGREEKAAEGGIMPVEIPRPRKGQPSVVEVDEEPIPGSPRPALADGAAALVLASASWAGDRETRPLATLDLLDDPLGAAADHTVVHADLPERGWEELRRRAGAGSEIRSGGPVPGHAAGADGARLAALLAHSPPGVMAVAGDGHGTVVGVSRRS